MPHEENNSYYTIVIDRDRTMKPLNCPLSKAGTAKAFADAGQMKQFTMNSVIMYFFNSKINKRNLTSEFFFL